jgi:steroid delta-isomerase-like uncharacterized protein
MSSIERFITDLLDALNAHDVERLVSFYAPDFEEVDVGQARPQRGLDGLRRTASRYFRAFPDLQFTRDDLIVQAPRAVLIWTMRGTHQGALMNIPPTGRAVAVRGTSVLTVENGKIKNSLRVWDMAGMLRALGLLPDL